ncbi:hypothetical protein [Paludisphaera mucosa]|uniref:Uncharacterized protein n=1 Tax=Paludisphaera mucosa TaxID=3030827 RepID=A0ABT6F9R5_9BACT|nr:hypothetical protein [Paludisphaera mucosa]MDG3004317.1 hypothetical protein [Paludisphaera mucosa]
MSDEAGPPGGRPAGAIGGHWLSTLGFAATHEPGISRAWRLDLEDGYLLITDLGGYDLPDVGAPASAYAFTKSDDLLDFAEFLVDSRALHGWIRSARRRSRWRSRGGRSPD